MAAPPITHALFPHRRGHRAVWGSLFLVGILLAPLPSQGAEGEGVGRVLSAVGTVEALALQGDQQRPLERRSWVYEQEVVRLGDQARAQMRFKDGAMIRLRAGSRFRIHKYRSKAEGDNHNRVYMELVKGGLQTLTGQIGEKQKEAYKVDTPVASVGIRGTHYAIRYCQGQCGEQVAKGLYGGVMAGKLTVRNQAGQATFGKNAFFHVKSAQDKPQAILRPDTSLVGASRQQEESEGTSSETDSPSDNSGTESGAPSETGTTPDSGENDFDEAPDGKDADSSEDGTRESLEEERLRNEALEDTATTESETEGTQSETFSENEITATENSSDTDPEESPTDTDPEEPPTDTDPEEPPADTDPEEPPADTTVQIDEQSSMAGIAFAGDTSGSGSTFPIAFITPQAGGGESILEGDGDGNLIEIGGTFEDSTGLLTVAEGATPLQSGQDEQLNVGWGAWAGEDYQTANETDLTHSGPVHYVHTDNPTTTTMDDLAHLETQTYSDFQGTTPTDQLGNEWSVDAISLEIDFQQAQLQNTTVEASHGNQSIAVQQLEPSAITNSGLLSAVLTGSGNQENFGFLQGTLVGDEAQGAAVSFSVTDSSGTTVSGAGGLRR